MTQSEVREACASELLAEAALIRGHVPNEDSSSRVVAGLGHADLLERAASLIHPHAEIERLREALTELRTRRESCLDMYHRNGPQWTSRETGAEYYDASYVIENAESDIELITAALTDGGSDAG